MEEELLSYDVWRNHVRKEGVLMPVYICHPLASTTKDERIDSLNVDDYLLMELTVEPINSLHPHEEVKMGNLSRLVASFRESGIQMDPIIIDSESKVILDGMHRYHSMWQLSRETSVAYIVVCKINYSHPSVKLMNWHRIFEGLTTTEIHKVLDRIQAEPNVVIEKTDETTGMIEVLERRAIMAIINPRGRTSNAQRETWLVTADNLDEWDILTRYRLIRQAEVTVMELKLSVNHVPDVDVIDQQEMQLKETVKDFVVITPKITKEEVIDISKKGQVFPPKSTRHSLPARPLRVNYPLNFLESRVKLIKSRRGRMQSSTHGLDRELLLRKAQFRGFLTQKRRFGLIRRGILRRNWSQYRENILYLFS